METSTFDPCLLITGPKHDKATFGMTALQTDDTLTISTPAFSKLADEKIEQEKIRCKPTQELTPDHSLDFNGARLTKEDDDICMRQRGQGAKIELVDTNAPDCAQKYAEQRARGAYLASICQPEAAFDLSVAAQSQQPTATDYAKLNKRLQWQIDNLDRGLRFVPIDITKAKLMVFVDGSFANNSDLSSQIGFVIALVTEESNEDKTCWDAVGNVVHWSSTKCKRITRSVLASEIYGMVNGFDMGVVISTTMRKVTDRLGIDDIPLIVCTDSFSLYECLVKLGTTKEKRLMIDVMALRQSYERREIHEIRWINGEDNPADAMTKASPNKALEKLVSENKLRLRVKGHVDRKALTPSRL